MLSGKGFKKIFNMAGGIKAWQSETAIGSKELGMDIFVDKESPVEILKTAYSLEQGLREFYLAMEKKTDNSEVKKLFALLSDIEVKHQMSIFMACRDLTSNEITREDFESQVTSKAMEGGLTTDEYLDLFQPDLESPVDVISLAMSIEAQALDLYQRLGMEIKNPVSRDIVEKIANEEKAHLASLGDLMEQIIK